MAALHLLTFPGALIPSIPIIGGAKTVSWLYVLWGLGFVGLLVTAVIASDSADRVRDRGRAELHVAIGTTLAVAVLLAVLLLADPVLPPFAVGDQFSPWGMRASFSRMPISARPKRACNARFSRNIVPASAASTM